MAITMVATAVANQAANSPAEPAGHTGLHNAASSDIFSRYFRTQLELLTPLKALSNAGKITPNSHLTSVSHEKTGKLPASPTEKVIISDMPVNVVLAPVVSDFNAAYVDTRAKKVVLDGQQNLPISYKNETQFLPPPEIGRAPTLQGQAVSFAPVIKVPLNEPSWPQQMSHQLLSMLSLKINEARIEVNPPHLGPIEVMMRMDDNKSVQVLFSASNATTREMLENHLPKLSQLLSAGGSQLTDAEVSSGQQQPSPRSSHFRAPTLPVDTATQSDTMLAALWAAQGVLAVC